MFKNICAVLGVLAVILFALFLVCQQYFPGFDSVAWISANCVALAFAAAFISVFLSIPEKLCSILLLFSAVGLLYCLGVFREDAIQAVLGIPKELKAKIDGEASAEKPKETSSESSDTIEPSESEMGAISLETVPEDTSKYPTIGAHLNPVDREVFRRTEEQSDIAFLLIAWREWSRTDTGNLLKELKEFRKANFPAEKDFHVRDIEERINDVLKKHYLKIGEDFAGRWVVQVIHDDPAHHAELARIRNVIKSASTE